MLRESNMIHSDDVIGVTRRFVGRQFLFFHEGGMGVKSLKSTGF
jgi:hypothetical protein